MNIEQRLHDLGIQLNELPKPLGSYVPCVRAGNLLFLSGVLPLRDGKLTRTGKVGESVTLQQAQEDAMQVAINALSILHVHLGSLERVKRCVKVNGFVASSPGFTQQPAVLNGCSDFLVEVFGDAGRHARSAVGVAVLPLDAPVEVDFIFETTPE
ncbi:MAG TPA: RidA family protein [Dissulfurispiraceae bacterium]|nr:RidA family protein [Dissulfurispiraceae bacterium]